MSAVVFSPLRDYIFPHAKEQVSPTPTPTPLPTPKTDESGRNKESLQGDFSVERLREQYDSFSSRFSAVEGSLRKRALDLGDQSIKPEITAALQTTRSDLAETRDALAARDLDRAERRLRGIDEELRYLESL
jgi:hypothetical protein